MRVPRRCPKCAGSPELDTRTVEGRDPLHRVEIDVCTHCLGVWLDRTEPQRLWEIREFLAGITASAHVQEDLRRGKCPACPDPDVMQRVPVGAFALDRCLRCGGVWFDGGELAPTLTRDGYLAMVHALNAAIPR